MGPIYILCGVQCTLPQHREVQVGSTVANCRTVHHRACSHEEVDMLVPWKLGLYFV